MDFKKKWQRFWTLDRHHAEGFTLVELVVVIAIMAILAGVAVPAYTGYIKKAREASDMQLLAAVNTAFASACLENSLPVSDVEDAKMNLLGGKIQGMSSITPDTVSASTINSAFFRYYQGNENATFVTENVNSLVWNKEESSFEFNDKFFDMVLTLADGTTLNISGTALTDMIGSTYDAMGSDSLLAMVGKNIETAKSIFSLGTGTLGDIAGALGGIIGSDSVDIKAKVVNALKTGGSFYDLIPDSQRNEILAQFEKSAPNPFDWKYLSGGADYKADKAAYDAAQEKANSQLANAAALYVGNTFTEKRVTGTDYYNKLLTSTDPVTDVGKLAEGTGGMGQTLLNASISAAAQEGFVNSTGKDAFAAYVAANPGKTANDFVATEEGKAAYKDYLQSPTCEKDLNAFVGAMTTVNSNVDALGREEFIAQGITNANLKEMMGSLLG